MDEKEIKYLIDGIDVPYILIRFKDGMIHYDCDLTDEEASSAVEAMIKIFQLEFNPAAMPPNAN